MVCAAPSPGGLGCPQDQGFVLLPILPRHLEAVRSLTCAHADPFDRLLIAQAQDERLTQLTRDAEILGLDLAVVVKG